MLSLVQDIISFVCKLREPEILLKIMQLGFLQKISKQNFSCQNRNTLARSFKGFMVTSVRKFEINIETAKNFVFFILSETWLLMQSANKGCTMRIS